MIRIVFLTKDAKFAISDSRQRAAKLARDMSEASDISAARQLFAIAVKTMEDQTVEQSMNSLYDYFCLAPVSIMYRFSLRLNG